MVKWFSTFLTSSIGQKVIMSLTGLFLISFLLVHLVGNFQLLYLDEGQAFNDYAYFMTGNPAIKSISYGLYAFILLHAIQGITLAVKNRRARGNERYAVKVNRVADSAASSLSSVYMGSLGTIIFIFILIHMYQFWLKMKIGDVPAILSSSGDEINNLYFLVEAAFANPLYVAFYVISMIFIAFHLWHGFTSAFQTLGLNHKKYTPLIKTVGRVYAVLIPLGFAVIPVVMYLRYIDVL